MQGGTCEATAYALYGYRTAAMCVALGNYHNCGPGDRIAPEYVSLEDTLGKAWRRFADRTKIPPIAERHEFGDRDRKPTIKFVLLRQIGQAMTRESSASDLASRRPNNARERFQERTLPGPVGTDDGCKARRQEFAGQALECVSCAIAHGKVANRDTFISPTTSTRRAGIVTAVKITSESGLRPVPQSRKQRAE